MESIIIKKQMEIEALCRKYHVKQLEVFGSASVGQTTKNSDLDFLVEFDNAVGRDRFDTFFALLESLTDLFGRPVDLIEPGGLRNPYFIRRVNETRRPVYVA